jgi:hypothetical protein
MLQCQVEPLTSDPGIASQPTSQHMQKVKAGAYHTKASDGITRVSVNSHKLSGILGFLDEVSHQVG